MAEKGGATPDDIMSAAAMKPMIAKARQEPIHCAIALTEAKLGVVLLHAKTKPKKLLAELRKSAKDHKLSLDAASLRFGTAVVDPEDTATLRMTINKDPAGGMEARLRVQLKGSGCSTVVFSVDPSLEAEPEDEAPGEAAPAAPAATATAPPAAAPAAAAPGPAGAAALAQLMQQIPKVAGADAALQQSLVKLAQAAAGAAKGADAAAANAAVEALRRALATAAEAKAAGTGGAVAYGKARLAWLATRQRMAAELDKLRVELQAEYSDESDGAEILTAYDRRVAPVLAALDERLADKLDEATNATDAARRTALVGEAKGLIGEYQKFLAGEKLIADLDDNPFVPLNIQKLVSGTLTALAATVH